MGETYWNGVQYVLLPLIVLPSSLLISLAIHES